MRNGDFGDPTRFEIERHMDNELLLLWWYMAAVAHSAVVILGSRARNGVQQCVEHQWSTTKTGTSVPCKKCSIVFEIAAKVEPRI